VRVVRANGFRELLIVAASQKLGMEKLQIHIVSKWDSFVHEEKSADLISSLWSREGFTFCILFANWRRSKYYRAWSSADFTRNYSQSIRQINGRANTGGRSHPVVLAIPEEIPIVYGEFSSLEGESIHDWDRGLWARSGS